MSELPEGWAVITLGTNVSRLTKGSTPTSYGFEYQSKGISFIKVENLRAGVVDRSSIRHFISHDANAYQRRSMLSDGDVLFSIAGTIGETALVGAADLPANTNQALAIIRPFPELTCPAFLRLQLASPTVKGQIGAKERGGGMNNVSLSDLGVLSVVLPPLPEQHRIVAKLDALLSRVNASRQRLNKIPKLLARFRQSVLAAACSGRLSADWRDSNPNLESAEELLQRLTTLTPEPHEDVFQRTSMKELPPSWSWAPLGKLGSVVGGGTPSKDNREYWNGNIPWVSPKDMKRDRIRNTEDHISQAALAASFTKLVPQGTILFVVRGMILNHTLPVAITDAVVTLNQDMKALVPEQPRTGEYLFLASRFLAKQMLFAVKEATHGTRRIETPLLKNWAVPLPPLAEQQEIVRRVDQLFAFADRLEARVETARKRVDALTQSILAKAFGGELVPTEAELARAEGRAFESAAELLARMESLNGQGPAKQSRNQRKRKPERLVTPR